MAGNLLIAQSGGPTAVINATLSGILEEGLLSGEIDRIYGSRYGIQGLLEEKLLELSQRIPELLQRDFPGRSREDALSRFLQRLSKTPAAALGSCRYKLEDPSEFERILELFRKYGISYFIYIGGNDSMDTAWKLSRFFRERGEEGITV
ncbi:MAG: 6-phosphofructokinase, partial [Oribacterium sp.]